MTINYLSKYYDEKSKIAKDLNFNPYYQTITSALEQKIIINNQEYIDLASNNYLGLSNNKKIKKAIIKAIKTYGISMCGTPIATGSHYLYQKAIKALNCYIGCEDGIILPSCYQANSGLFQVIADASSVIVCDQNVHASLLAGVKATKAKCFLFRHNDLKSLLKKMQNIHQFKNILVVTESVFSTEGVIAPIKEIKKICNQFNAKLLVDDSHGLGVIGENGKGIINYENILFDEKLIYTASLGKAFANIGGYIGGKKETIELLRYLNPSLIYSTALPPPLAMGIIKTIELMTKNGDILLAKLKSNKQKIKEALEQKNILTIDKEAPLISILAGTDYDTFLLAKKFYQLGILTTPFVSPSVAKDQGIVRLIVGAHLNNKTINQILAKIARIE